jgi:hypothetical protein
MSRLRRIRYIVYYGRSEKEVSTGFEEAQAMMSLC